MNCFSTHKTYQNDLISQLSFCPEYFRYREQPKSKDAKCNMFKRHFYGLEDSYARIDYILLSPAMKAFWLPGETYIPTIPNWGLASDHRPLVASFTTEPK
jgi:hypothetical protein